MKQEHTVEDFICFEDENLLKGYIMYNFYYSKQDWPVIDKTNPNQFFNPKSVKNYTKILRFENYYTLLKKNEIVAKNGKNSYLVNVKRLNELRLEDCYYIYFKNNNHAKKELLKFLTNYYFVENNDLNENIIETLIPQLEEKKILKENGKYLILSQASMKNYNYVLYKNYYTSDLVILIENKNGEITWLQQQ